MNPLNFITVARQLWKSEDEANLRSAASRAYYGAFHFAGERLEASTSASANPFRWSNRRKNHKILQDEWADRQGDTGQAIANYLYNAHELRKKADYDLDTVSPWQTKTPLSGLWPRRCG